MKLNHINLTVDDVPAAAAFLTRYFGMQSLRGVRVTPRFAVLTDDHGMILTLIHLDGQPPVAYPDTFHVGFGQATPADVDAIHRRMAADGHDAPPPSRQHGSWTFYTKAPGGFMVEVLC